MNVPPAYDSRASKRAMSSSRDSYLRLTGRVVPFSRPYPLTPKINVGLEYGDGKMPPPPSFSHICPGDCNGPVQVRGKCRGAGVREGEMANPAKRHNPISGLERYIHSRS